MFFLVPDCPDVGCDGLHVTVRQRHASHWRHGAGMFLGLRHAVPNGLFDGLEAAVAPEPLAAGEIGAYRRPDAVGSVTTCACRAIDFAGKDLLAECNFFSRCTRRYRKTCLGMDALGRRRLR